MYYDDNVKININWKALILKVVLIALAILLVIWFFPMPKLDTFYNRIYNDNLNAMKEVSEKYFTGDKLPANTGSSTTIKLQDMLDKKLITSFTDKNNNACSATNSYAQVTKTDNNNYVLKVQLSCDEKTDYVLENLNTSNSNNSSSTSDNKAKENENSDKNTTSVDGDDDGIEIDKDILNGSDPKYDKDSGAIEYQFKREIKKTATTYTCPEGYIKNNNVCYKEATGETIDATPLYFEDFRQESEAKENTTGSYTKKTEVIKTEVKSEKVCPEGYTLNGDICYKYVNATVVPGTTTYSCPEGWTLSGTTCTQSVNVITNTTPGTAYYTCPNGGTLNGTVCQYSARSNTTSGSTTCKCPSGYSDNGSNCKKTTTTSAQWHAGSTSYGNCPSGFSPSGNSCVKKTTYGAKANVSWSNPIVTNSKTQLSTYSNSTSKRVLANKSCTLKGCTYTYYTYTAKTTYSCPNGGNLSGTTCTKTETRNRPTNTTSGYYTCNGNRTNSSTCSSTSYANKTCKTKSGKTTYSCPNGGTLSGTTCTYNATKQGTGSSSSISCPAGYTMSGNKCIKTMSATAHTTSTEYTCPQGYVREGTTCYQYSQSSTKKTYSYTCPEGFDKKGEGEATTCTKFVEATTSYYCEDESEELVGNKCIKTIKGGLKGYDCPSGYILDKDKCYKKTTETINATEITNTTVSYEYKWSSESHLDGWTPTGKTRTVNSPSTNNTNLYEK